MKQLLRKSLVMVVMFTTINSYSNGFNYQSKEQTANVTSVSIDSVNAGSQLLIKDDYGVILYKEQIEKTGTYTKKFDLTSLLDANYYFELEKQNEIVVIPFIVKENIAEFKKEDEYKIVKPDVVVRDKHVYISKPLADTQSWRIEVYYEGYDLAYSEKIKDTQYFDRVYDFTGSEKGNYTIVFSSEGRVFKNNVGF